MCFDYEASPKFGADFFEQVLKLWQNRVLRCNCDFPWNIGLPKPKNSLDLSRTLLRVQERVSGEIHETIHTLEELVVESLDDCCFGGWLVHREEEMEMVPLERGIHDLGWFQSPGSSYAVILFMAAEYDTLLKDNEHLPTKFRINYYPQLKIAVFQLPTVWWQRYRKH